MATETKTTKKSNIDTIIDGTMGQACSFEELMDGRKALAHFASQWVDGKALKMVENADQIVVNPAVRILLTEWSEAKDNYDKKRRAALRDIAMGCDPVCDLESVKLLYGRKVEALAEALHTLLLF